MDMKKYLARVDEILAEEARQTNNAAARAFVALGRVALDIHTVHAVSMRGSAEIVAERCEKGMRYLQDAQSLVKHVPEETFMGWIEKGATVGDLKYVVSDRARMKKAITNRYGVPGCWAVAQRTATIKKRDSEAGDGSGEGLSRISVIEIPVPFKPDELEDKLCMILSLANKHGNAEACRKAFQAALHRVREDAGKMRVRLSPPTMNTTRNIE